MSKNKKEFEDDQRTVADMSALEDIPALGGAFGNWKKHKKQDKDKDKKETELSKSERGMLIRYVLLAALGIAAVFGIAFGLVILFMTKVWFH